MTEPHTGTPAPSTAVALVRALTGGLVMATALGVGTALGPAAADALGLTGFPARVLPARWSPRWPYRSCSSSYAGNAGPLRGSGSAGRARACGRC
ncbi:hypothetical protein [Streptomyces sp. MK37H]|uniref:hypothetical protein n=1 Tax=Streptomyces sp. MK37H TaxID=2699117 RepID=UPI001FFA7153|nr:hypothetical protein [Streptomyces sp. MK37H]